MLQKCYTVVEAYIKINRKWKARDLVTKLSLISTYVLSHLCCSRLYAMESGWTSQKTFCLVLDRVGVPKCILSGTGQGGGSKVHCLVVHDGQGRDSKVHSI